MTPASPDLQSTTVLLSARAFFNNGEFFRSYDLAKEAMERFPTHTAFAHLAVLSLANAGAIELALEKFSLFGLDNCHDPEAEALLARLKKDLGFACQGTARLHLHQQARTLYLQIYQRALAAGASAEAYYPAINAAALSVWCDDRPAAADLAQQVLGLLEALEPLDSPDDRYWRRATQAEACLILGRLPELERLLPSVRSLGQGKYAQTATTERQLTRLAQALALPTELLRGLALPAIAHYSGHIIQGPGRTGRFPAHEETTIRRQMDTLLTAQNVGAAYGSLAAGADILFAEAILARGATLHIVLPFAKADFIEFSVLPSGPAWVPRFEACLAAAQSVRFATEDHYLRHDALFAYCSQLAMGLAVLAARHLQAPVLQCVVWDGVAAGGQAGTVADMVAWNATGHLRQVIRCGPRTHTDDLAAFVPTQAPTEGREIHAMLFGDLHGFSRLNDRELPHFARNIMGPISRVVHTFRSRLSSVNTWGDGIFAVFKDVREAAAFALDLQQCMRHIDLAAAELPNHLQLRLGGHLGPVYEIMDPVLNRINFYGTHVSRAARIEPVTPEGCVYVTETFAAVLALEDSTTFACDYAGYTEMAKHYGQLRIFLLRRITGELGPTVLSDIERPPLQSVQAVAPGAV